MLPVAAAPAVQGSVMSLLTGYGCNNGTVQGGSEERLEGRADCSPSMRVYSLYTKGDAGADDDATFGLGCRGKVHPSRKVCV